MADFYLKSGSGVTHRENSTAYATGDRMVIGLADTSTNYAVTRKWVFECTTAGTSGAAVPTWSASYTQDVTTVTDGTVVWTARKPGFSSGSTINWTYAHIRLDWLASAVAAGDYIFVSSVHAETTSGVVTITLPGTTASPNYIISCTENGASRPTTVTAGATVTNSSGSASTTIRGAAYSYGVIYAFAGSIGNGYLYLNDGSTSTHTDYDNCTLDSTAVGGGRIYVGTQSDSSYARKAVWSNVNLKFASSAGGLASGGPEFTWKGGGFAVGTTAISTLLHAIGSGGRATGRVLLSDLDLSNGLTSSANIISASGLFNSHIVIIKNCKLPAAWSGALYGGSIESYPGARAEMYNCDSGDTNYKCWIEDYAGTIKDFTTLYPTGTDGLKLNTIAVPICFKMASSALCKYPLIPLVGMDYAIVNETTTSQTVTLEIIHNESAALNDNEVWLEVDYPATSGSTQFASLTDAATDVLTTGSDQTASTTAWDSGITARANSTAYSVGNMTKVAINSGRVFICTAGGTSSGSEPAGYATAVDGDSVVDGGATFKAMRRQKLEVTFTAAEQGVIYARPVLAKADAIVYVSEKLTVT